MTTEEKQLLLKDLSARLPYVPQIHITSDECDDGFQSGEFDNTLRYHHLEAFVCDRIEIKPYLRPMSSMTKEEETLFRCELPAIAKTDAQLVAMRMELFLKGHLDFNHLIEKGLALEAPEGMYKME